MAKKETETLQYQHADFTLYLSADYLHAARNKLNRTYLARGLGQPSFKDMQVFVGETPMLGQNGTAPLQPFFFENKQYWFEIEFKGNVDDKSYEVNHKYALLDQSFAAHPNRKSLQAAINFGNDVGLCRFDIQYRVNGTLHTVPVTFTVFATKMIQSQDLGVMNLAIDRVYPLWRYAISSKTTHQQGKSTKQPEKFELFWLAQFELLQKAFNQGVKRILNAPHNRLQTYSVQQNLERVTSRLSAKQEELARELIAAQRVSRLPLKKQRLSLDTPENRFIKMVLVKIKNNLNQILLAISNDKDPIASDSFINTLAAWRDLVAKFEKQPLWQQVGAYKGQNAESKVLQEGAGYAKVYNVWQQLKHYLNSNNGDSQLAIKSVADIYEIWCFLEVKNIIEALGFRQQEIKLSNLKQVQFEKQFPADEMAAAFVYHHDRDQMKIELAHEPSFTPIGKHNRTWHAKQRPDIVLRVTLANGEAFFILFDAKYRIDDKHKKDLVPEDAINQMHRYRDAIIHQQHLGYEAPLKSRPVLGAFALYPGFFQDQKNEQNPYAEAIKEIGIGAFALLPSADAETRHNYWLKEYLAEKLAKKQEAMKYKKPSSHDYYFVEDSVRIAPYGVNISRYHGLTFVAPVNEIDRSEVYLENAKSGKLKGYHTRLIATNRQNIHRNIIREIRYLVLTVRENPTDNEQVAKYLYPVAKVRLLPRIDIPEDIAGKSSSSSESYWLFEFSGDPIPLKSAIKKPYIEHFQFKLTKAEFLPELTQWDDIQGDLAIYSDFSPIW